MLNGACPRHMGFIFGQSDVGHTPSATYSAQLIPRVPHNDFKYKGIMETIQSHPHLFKIITPICIKHLKALLHEHLNHPLVESFPSWLLALCKHRQPKTATSQDCATLQWLPRP